MACRSWLALPVAQGGRGPRDPGSTATGAPVGPVSDLLFMLETGERPAACSWNE
ncbi:MAG TPA: hypothetical protein VKB88_13730 [Bryobacteraceae bacterium]|nr:hypothetical protein [Bryobacteraceae bacterium]